MDDTDQYRCRLIYLKQTDTISKQAEAACEAVAGIEGVILAAPFDSHSVHLIYSLDNLSFELLTDLLNELGFELENSILLSLRNTIFEFLEANVRDNMHIDVTKFQADSDEDEAASLPRQSSDKYWEDYH
ncbi:MAG: hypothetical protein ACI9YO_001889 [Gammaproteobacteria bacterium]|jgi:hypothetical protein